MGNASGGSKGLGRATSEQSSGSPWHQLPLSPMGTAASMAAPRWGQSTRHGEASETLHSKHNSGSRRLTCLVATSERFRRVQRQFWTSLGLELVRCLPNACMPPAREGDTSPRQRPDTKLPRQRGEGSNSG